MKRLRKTWLSFGLLASSAVQVFAQTAVPRAEDATESVVIRDSSADDAEEAADDAEEAADDEEESADDADESASDKDKAQYDYNAGMSDGCCDIGCDTGCDDGCDSDCIPCRCEPWRLLPQDGCVRAYGWLDAGVPFNFASPDSHFNGPFNAQFRDEPQLNQLYGVIEAPVDPCGCLSVGGRIDLLYGTDYLLAQSNGVEREADGSPRWNSDNYYGLAMPQAYGEVAWENVSLKLGHFYTVVGYEGVPAPANFFYTKSYSYTYAGPFTQWGALATLDLTDRLVVDTGIVNGWDSLDQATDRASFLGRTTYYVDDSRTSRLVGSMITGDQPGFNGVYGNRTRIDTFADLLLTDRLQYVLQYNHSWQEDGVANGDKSSWYGLANYAYYTMNCDWKAGLRLEWFRDEDGTRVAGAFPQNPNQGPYEGSFYQTAVGLNWTPTSNLMVRPEMRFDWFDGTGLPFDDGSDTDQSLAAVDAILQF